MGRDGDHPRREGKGTKAGLWNLFLPVEYQPFSPGLTNLEYAPLAELMGRSEIIPAPPREAPDTGNAEVLAKYGSPNQQKRWLEPLLAGQIRSTFAMTEPHVASSDATNIETSIRREGDEYVINGYKYYASNACHADLAFIIVMGKTAPEQTDRYRQIVPNHRPEEYAGSEDPASVDRIRI